ncbi:GAF domain-containing protein [Rhodovarius crocodyli]|uniref:histidine kinase n=1 Tax=Rhodovarius crocodyli TaxID=1979269 RepID=A0A437MJW0_9PROT|nr:HWE histidine kinase domain-containing protein [Rhodovarius crocodyli]RVT97875.1 GAF domain-containing protein [Rhodovarius crocodyli]
MPLESTIPVPAVDLTNCDREPIHRLGRIQGFGLLIATSTDWIVQYVSENAGEWLHQPAGALIGQPIANHVSPEFLATLREHLNLLSGADDVERVFDLSIHAGGEMCDVALHMAGDLIIIECEPARAGPESNDSMVRRIVQRLHAAPSIEKLHDTAAQLVMALTGFDRVMIYRFLHDESGEVIAEARQHGIDSFLGQRYPASDIPRQARELYKRNPIRIIADVDGPSHAILPLSAPDGMPIDLSNSVLRSVSPIHLEYLRNMGVCASMSVSIMLRGKLWGLIACHHYSPRRVPLNVRTATELVGRVFSLALDAQIRDSEMEAERRALDFHSKVLRMVGPQEGPVSQLTDLFPEMCALVECDGIGMIVDGKIRLWRHAPDRMQFLELVDFLNRRTAAGSIQVTHELSRIFPRAKAFAERASGMMAIPVSRRPRDYLVFFRKEVEREIRWAGNPEKPVTVGPLGARLTPRESFELWRETARGQSEPWTLAQRRLAEGLRVSLLEVILKHADLLENERKAARQRQELLIGELNHRVRNILGLIRGLIRQVDTDRSAEDFVEVFDHRVQALARAHDQLTARDWSSGSLFELIETETTAFGADSPGRVVIEGEDVGLKPQSFSAMALVIHELTTNSAKYGALHTQTGRLSVRSTLDEAGWLTLEWVESGGPPVQAPKDGGFGAVLIGRTVAHDLGGTVDQDFRLDGLRMTLRVAPEHMARLTGAGARRAAERARKGGLTFPPGRGLVVEDNVIIAMDSEMTLRSMGCEGVVLASSVRRSLEVIAKGDIGFAVLDVNLGQETSFPVADALAERGIPFIFLSGYADSISFPEAHKKRPQVRKPFDAAALSKALASVFSD